MDKIKVIIADDHALVREGLRRLLELDPNIEVLTEVGDGQGAINMVRKLRPDIVLMDVNMPGTDGIIATRVIKREMPSVRVVALTIYEDEEVIETIKDFKESYFSKKDWWNEISEEEKNSIDRGLKDAEEGRLISYEQFKNKYKKWISD